MYIDSSYILCMIPAFLLTALAQFWVNSTYRKWLQAPNSMRVSGADAAQRMRTHAGLQNVGLAGAQGQLSDHYDPRSKTLHLSQQVATVPSVASLAIAAHEIGHAVQDNEGYGPLRLRSALVPAAGMGSNLGWILLVIGFAMQSFGLGA